MPRVVCPHCDRKVKVPADHDRPSIRCSSCGKKIHLDQDDEEQPQEAQPPSSITWVAVVGFVLTLLALAACVGVGYFYPGVGFVMVIGLGLSVTYSAFLGSAVLAGQDGRRIGFFTFHGLPAFVGVILMIFACGLYLAAYYMTGMTAVARSVKNRPGAYAPWLVLQVLGLMIFFAPPLLHGTARDAGWFDAPGKELAKGGDPPAKDGAKEKTDPAKPPPKVENQPLKLTGDGALDAVLTDLASPDGKRFKAAAEGLTGMAPNEHRPVVAQHLAAQVQDAPTYNRTLLVRALAVWATPKETPVLVQLLSDKDINTRNETLKALGKLKDETAAGPMVRCLLEIGTQSNAESALKAMGPGAETEVLALLAKKDKQTSAIAIRILAEIGTQQSVPVLQEAANGPAPTRSQAAKALAAINVRTKK